VPKTKDIVEAPPDGWPMAPVHPGEVLGEELEARALTAHALAMKLRVPANRITEIAHGKRGISADTALRLGRYFGTGALFWLNLQSQYDLATAQRELGARIAAEVEQAA
jgi:addiction module HigA family antidote